MMIANTNILTGNSHSEMVSIWLTLRNSGSRVQFPPRMKTPSLLLDCPDGRALWDTDKSRLLSPSGQRGFSLPLHKRLEKGPPRLSLGHSLCIIEIAAHRIQGEVVGKWLCK